VVHVDIKISIHLYINEVDISLNTREFIERDFSYINNLKRQNLRNFTLMQDIM